MFFIFENSWFWCSSRDLCFPNRGFDGISAYSFILRDYLGKLRYLTIIITGIVIIKTLKVAPRYKGR